MRHALRLVGAAALGSLFFAGVLLVLGAAGGLCLLECGGQDPWAEAAFNTAWPLVPLLVYVACVGLALILIARRAAGG